MARFKIAWVTVLFAVVAACSSSSPSASNGGSSGASGSTNATGGGGSGGTAAGGTGGGVIGSAGSSVSGSSGGLCDAGAPLTVTSNHTPDTTVGASYSYSYQATGGCPPYTWTVTSGWLPPGLTMSQDGTIAGSATTMGTYSFTVQCCDSAGTCTSNDRGINVTAGNGSGGSGGSGGTGASGGSAGAGATGGSAGMGTLSGCTVNASNQPVCGSGVGSAAVPSGWALVKAEGFDANGGSLGDKSVESLNDASIQCSFAHTGNCALHFYYTSGEPTAIWQLASGVVGSSHEVDVSWWEYSDHRTVNWQSNDIRAHFLASPSAASAAGVAYSSTSVDDWNGSGPGGCLNGVGPGSTYNCQSSDIVSEGQCPTCAGLDNYGGYFDFINGSWVQWEIHFKANTVTSSLTPNSDGMLEVYRNGQLIFRKTNAKLNYVDDTDMEIQVGGYYSMIKYTNSAGTICEPPAASGVTVSDCTPFASCAPCPVPPDWNRYWDDIIVLKK